MGVVKLIDLEQEIFIPIYDEAQGVTYEQIMTVREMFDQFMGGYQPPIVDAIPVEWLEEQRNQVAYLPRGGKQLVRVVDGLLAMWRKEQGARM